MHIAEVTRSVNGISKNNSQAASLNDAALANIKTGVLLLCKEALVTAINDRRLDRLHLRILATIALCMNGKSAKAWPSRQTIADKLAVEPVTVSNKLRDLRAWGYLVAERQRVPEADNRSLMVYTFGNLDHETIKAEITKFCEAIQATRAPQKSPSTVTPKVTEYGDYQRKSPRAVTLKVTEGGDSCAKVTEYGDPKSPSTVDSNSFKGTLLNCNNSTGESAAQKAQRICDAMLAKYEDVFVVAQSPGLLVAADIRDWIEAGCDVERDIIPAIETVALQQRQKGKRVGSWGYVRNAVFGRKRDRESGRYVAPAPCQPNDKVEKLKSYLTAEQRALVEARNAGR